MSIMVPPRRPKATLLEVQQLQHKHGLLTNASVYLVGVRGYYRDSMGQRNKNDRGIYDDAMFIVNPKGVLSYNANTDPSKFRKGSGFGSRKGVAKLDPGVWQYKVGLHKGLYTALRQAGAVMVTRDGVPDYQESGWFGINIHKGSRNSTSSLGCQTIHPDQWNEFISRVRGYMREYGQTVIPYILIEQ